MKKSILFSAAFGLLALSSCRKDYTCDCTLDGYTQYLPIPDSKEKDVESMCDVWKAEYALDGGSCVLNVE